MSFFEVDNTPRYYDFWLRYNLILLITLQLILELHLVKRAEFTIAHFTHVAFGSWHSWHEARSSIEVNLLIFLSFVCTQNYLFIFRKSLIICLITLSISSLLGLCCIQLTLLAILLGINNLFLLQQFEGNSLKVTHVTIILFIDLFWVISTSLFELLLIRQYNSIAWLRLNEGSVYVIRLISLMFSLLFMKLLFLYFIIVYLYLILREKLIVLSFIFPGVKYFIILLLKFIEFVHEIIASGHP